jgi:hypothetical protein
MHCALGPKWLESEDRYRRKAQSRWDLWEPLHAQWQLF